MPELVSTLCTFLVLSPLVLTPGLGQFLFKPMAMGVAFSMIAAYILSRTLVPACSAYWLKPHAAHGTADDDRPRGRVEGAEGAADLHDQRQRPTPGQAGRAVRPRAAGLRAVGADDRAGHRVLRPGPRLRPATPRADDRARVRRAGGDDHRHVADHPPRFLPRGRCRRLRDVCPGPQRHSHRDDREVDQGSRGLRQGDHRRGGPHAGPLRDRRDRRLVGRLHQQRRARWTPWSRSSSTASGSIRRRNTSICCGPGSRRSRGSANWSSPSMPAAWSARR